MKLVVLLGLFVSTFWNAATNSADDLIPVQVLKNGDVYNFVEGQNLTIFINHHIFEIIPGGELSVIEQTDSIFSDLNRNLLNEDKVITLGIHLIRLWSIEYDWQGHNIYWLQHGLIEVADANGKYRKSLYKINTGYSMAIDPNIGSLFHIFGGESPWIETADMAGIEASRKVIVTGTSVISSEAVSMILDTEKGLVYWSDTILHRIQRCFYDGSQLELVKQFTSDVKITSIDIYKDTIYWIQYNAVTVNALSLSSRTSKPIKVIPESVLTIQYPGNINFTTSKIFIKVFDPKTSMKQDRNQTLLLTAKCPQLFLLSKYPPGYKCVCGSDYYQINNETCQRYEDVTIIGTSSRHKKISLFQHGTIETLNNDFPIQFYDIDFGETDNDVIFSSVTMPMYSSTITNFTQNITPINSTLFMYAFLVAYDWLTKNIYYAMEGGGNIQHTMIHVLSRHMYSLGVLAFTGRPSALSLDCESGLIFFTRPNMGQILKFGLDGRMYGRSVIALTNGFITNGLALDLDENKVYWNVFSLYSEFQMWRCRYSGMDKELVKTNLFISSIAVFEDFLFVVEMGKIDELILSRVNKDSIGDFTELHSFNETYDKITIYNHRIREKGSSPCMMNNGNCSQLCLISPRKPYYTCQCGDKYLLQNDRKSCVLLKCRDENGGCGMDCIEIQGGILHKCACRNGFTLQTDNKTCIGEMAMVLLSQTSSGLVLMDIKRHIPLFIHIGIKILRYTFNPVDRYFYAIREEDKHIIKFPFNGSGEVIQLTREKKNRLHMDIDWLSKVIYWWDDKSIWQFKYANESYPETELYIIQKQFGNYILSVQIDFLNGYLYIAEYEEGAAAIAESISFYFFMHCFKLNTFDQSGLRPCKWNRVSVGKSTFFQMTIDRFNLKMYIYRRILNNSSKEERIEVMNIDGQNLKTIKQSTQTNQMIGQLVILDGDLYTVGYDTINKVNKQSGDITTVFYKYYLNNYRLTSRNTIAVNVMSSTGNDEQCTDHEKCFGLVNKWICLKPDDICDGVPRCYDNYDEFLCSLCTEDCKIESLEFICGVMSSNHHDVMNISQFISWESHTFSKLVDLKSLLQFDCSVTFPMETSMDHVKMYEIHSVYHLYRLRQMVMAPLFKNLSSLDTIKLIGLPLLENLTAGDLAVVKNISSFYLEGSRIVSLPNLAFQGLLAVTEIYLVNNRYLRYFDPGCFTSLNLLRVISITGSQWHIVSKDQFIDQGNLTSLNLSSNEIQILEKGVFDSLVALRLIDLRFNQIILTSNVFLNALNLKVIYGDSFTICCIKPEGAVCLASVDDISSCRNLIGNRVLAPFLWLLGAMAFLGNLVVLIYRTFVDKSLFAKSYFIFVYNLGISDLIMALYMLIIAVHDALYDGIYVWNDYTWRHSTLCKIAGVLSMLSNEASLIFIFLISLERFLIVKFTFGNVRISRRLAFKLSFLTWVIAGFASMLPLVVYDDFYARSGVCIAIPLTKEINSGMEYAVVIFLGINFLTSVFIPFVLYQLYREVKISMKRVQSTQTGRDVEVAKRLSVVVITDCLCWLPVGILVILSLAGIKTPSDVYSWVIVLILPLNAAINPYIYTFSKADTIKQILCMKKIDKRRK